MKRVSIIVSTIDSGGAEKQAVLLAVQLSKYTDVNLIVLYGDHNEYELNTQLLVQSNVVVHRLKGNLLTKLLQVKRIIQSSKTGILFDYLTLPNVIGSIIGLIQGINVYNGIRSSRLPKVKMFVEKFIHNHLATGTIYNSFSGASYFGERGFKQEKNIVIPNCFKKIVPAIIREDRLIKRIITVGRFDPSKDYETLISSIAMLKRDDFCFCIVGYGALEHQIRSWIKNYGIEGKTEIHIKPNNVSELEQNSDIYISSSVFEGTSNSIMEALNWSLPVVATEVGDNDRLVINGETGFLHPIRDAVSISASIARLLDSIELRNSMGIKGNKLLREHYSIDKFEESYKRLIKE